LSCLKIFIKNYKKYIIINKKGFPYFKDIDIDQKESWIVIPIQVGYFELIDSGSSSGSASTSVSISESASKKQKI
jgi:hypothetical protein